ncbi:MAG TPA: glycolate oxidase subunit GlcE [Alphaproteobacteria bacterium]
MSEVLKPTTAAQLRDIIAWAAAEEASLDVRGRGTRRALGRPMQTSRTLDLSALAGIVSYEPEELVLTARAGTPMAEIDAALRERHQMLAFEPMDTGPLYGIAPDGGTLGGVVACNLSGPRRVKMGAARDHVLGFTGVSGRGESFKAGGKVVKNVTGYDLGKLLTGSFGTLAVMDEITLKVLPAPAKTRTVIVYGLDDATAAAAMADALNSPFEVSGAAHLPAAVARRSGVDYVRRTGEAVTALRVEGTGISVTARCAGLKSLLSARGALEELHTMNSARLWREVRDVAALLPDPGKVLWRLSVPPSDGPKVAAAIAAALDAEFFYDWGGGLVWLATAPAEDSGAGLIRNAVAATGGHATLFRASDSLRAAVPVFQPQQGALADITRRVKDAFDPKRILNPGRMYAGV